jgi:hypothetical protein
MSLPIPRLKKMVELTLKENPTYRGIEARNSDIVLMIIIWQRWYSVGTNDDSVVHLHRLFDLPREDNIKRVRAVFQNTEHRYLPTNWDVAKKRGIERDRWESALGYRLSADEVAQHHRTVASVKPPKFEQESMFGGGRVAGKRSYGSPGLL